MFNTQIQRQLNLFFLEEHTKLGLILDQFVHIEEIINRLLYDDQLNLSFCKILYPNMGNVTIFSRKWIANLVRSFFLSTADNQMFVIYTSAANKLLYIKLILHTQKMLELAKSYQEYHQQHDTFKTLIKNVIQENICPLSIIKSHLENILNNNEQLSSYLQPILNKLIKKQYNLPETICFKNGDLVKYLRSKVDFLNVYKDNNYGEICCSLKLLSTQPSVIFSEYTNNSAYADNVADNNLLSIQTQSPRLGF